MVLAQPATAITYLFLWVRSLHQSLFDLPRLICAASQLYLFAVENCLSLGQRPVSESILSVVEVWPIETPAYLSGSCYWLSEVSRQLSWTPRHHASVSKLEADLT